MIRIGIIQAACSPERDENILRTFSRIREAANLGAQVVCLQELFATTYFCHTESYDHFKLAESVPGPLTEQLQQLAKETGIVIIASLFEKALNGLYFNTVAVIDADGRYLGKYRKAHIPDDPGYYEKFYFSPGDTGYRVFQTKFGKLGTLICWDQWYPEAARITALKGSEILFYPTAIGWARSQDEAVNRAQYQAWQTIQRSHAIANGIPVVAVNRTGWEGDMHFWGGSFMCDAFGQILFEAPQDQEVVHVQEVSLTQSDEYRVHWPFLRDRRIDTYGPITNRLIEEE
ncbi:MAG: carbon-nitrogen hydrolase [Bacteroidetes bacterium]|nr:carbon-nitrogen hydrolase [Bacteroidota bacterium]